MIRNYVKTCLRNFMRNKLFSAISIVGLAGSMSAGLLLIAFIHDLLSYDRFHENGNRIYRITSAATFKDGRSENFATTSVRAHLLLKENLSLEDITAIRTEFGGDAHVGDKLIPLTGLYADTSFLRMFTFPLLQGDAATALQRPYSIVLTAATARKLFGVVEAFGKTIFLDTAAYQVTGILKDVPFFSHLQFEALVSLNTLEGQMMQSQSQMQWENVWQRNYVYVQLPVGTHVEDLQQELDRIAARENRNDGEAQIKLRLLSLRDIVLGDELSNSIGQVMPLTVLKIVSSLAIVVILLA